MSVADTQPRKAGPLQVLRMVLSAFVGIRRRDEHDKIVVTPLQVLITAIIAGALFVGTIVTVVRMVTGK